MQKNERKKERRKERKKGRKKERKKERNSLELYSFDYVVKSNLSCYNVSMKLT